MGICVNNPLVRSAVLEDLYWLASLSGYSEEAVKGVYKLLTSTLEGDTQQRELLNDYLGQKSPKAFNAKLTKER